MPLAIPSICLDANPSQLHEPFLVVPYDSIAESASSFDIVAASGDPVFHVALRGGAASAGTSAAGGRLLEVSRVPDRGTALASVRAEQTSGQGVAFILSSGSGSSGSVWGALWPSPDGEHGGFVLVRQGGAAVASSPAASADGHLRLVAAASGETCASSLIAPAGDFVAGTQQLEICIRTGIDPVLVLCCFVGPLLLGPARASEPAPSDDPADLGWDRASRAA